MKGKRTRERAIEGANFKSFSSPLIHEVMLADKVRGDAYFRAIRRHVRPGQTVLDLGTGTGILALMASRQAPERIYAVDRGPVIKLAEKIAAANHVKNIVFTKKDSFDFSFPGKADVILHDQIGDFLFNENMLAMVLDWRDRLLKPGGKILPARFELYLEPVQIKDEFHVPFLYESRAGGFDFSAIKSDVSALDMTRRLEFDQIGRYLCKPEKILEIDLETLQLEDMPDNLMQTRDVIMDGRLDGLFLYFKIIFDEETSMTTDFSNPWLNWTRQLLRCESLNVKAGQELNLDFRMPDPRDVSSWQWNCSV